MDAAIPIFEINDLFYQEAYARLSKSEALLNSNSNDVPNGLQQSKQSLEKALAIIDANNYIKLKIESYKIES